MSDSWTMEFVWDFEFEINPGSDDRALIYISFVSSTLEDATVQARQYQSVRVPHPNRIESVTCKGEVWLPK